MWVDCRAARASGLWQIGVMAARLLPTPSSSRLARLAARPEADRRHWARRFDRLLAHPAVSVPPLEQGLALMPGPAPGVAIAALARSIAPLLRAGQRVCIDLDRALSGGRTPSQLALLLESALPAALRGLGLAPSNLSLSFTVRAAASVDRLLALRRLAGLDGPRILLKLPDTAPSAPEAATLWRAAWQLSRQHPEIQLVLARSAGNACRLCGSEQPGAVLPGSGLAVPAGSAWLQIDLRVDQLRTSRAATNEHVRMLRDLLRFADNLIDALDWGLPETAADARRQRRVAVRLQGIGQLVDDSGICPADARSAKRLAAQLRALRRVLDRESRLLALERGAFEGLDVQHLQARLAERFDAATAMRLIRRQSLRHRHLLMASPFALLPGTQPRFPARDYLNLVPALSVVDSIGTYARPPSLGFQEQRLALQLSWAVAERKD
jgi:hypothetical protein